MKTKILILGATGMLGHVLLREFHKNSKYDLIGTVRDINDTKKYFPAELAEKIIPNIDALKPEIIKDLISKLKPDVVINCIGIIKQLPNANDAVTTIAINALLPHQIASYCKEAGARMIHVSTDCIFDGVKGNYTEQDTSNAKDLYGKTKALGEVNYDHCLTLRTSMIGHEIKGKYELIEWFFAQTGKIKGFKHAIYTGLPTIEIARLLDTVVIPDPSLKGLYQVSSQPISKYELLKLVAKIYSKTIEIEPDDNFKCDRSLNGNVFEQKTNYTAPDWETLVKNMYDDYKANQEFYI